MLGSRVRAPEGAQRFRRVTRWSPFLFAGKRPGRQGTGDMIILMNKGLVALASGTFVLGISEYVMMGILPDVSEALAVSIPEAGRLISLYAVGVCVGAFSLLFLRKLPPKRILLILSYEMLAGAILAVTSVNYGMLLFARFIEGLPHGAYFGAASIVAVKLAEEGKKASAVSIMCAGMALANLLGNPLASLLSGSLSWRVPFVALTCLCLVELLMIWRWVPQVEALQDTGMKGQFRFLRNLDPWLILLTTLFMNCGIFAWYSYISPLLQHASGFSAKVVPYLMVIAGAGMMTGTLGGGRLADRFRPGRTTLAVSLVTIVLLGAVFFTAQLPAVSLLLTFLLCACLFAVSAPEQLMILEHAGGGEMLGGCCIQVAFNLGNAIGAYLGGLPIDAGLSYNYTGLVGVPIAVLGSVAIFLFIRKYEKA